MSILQKKITDFRYCQKNDVLWHYGKGRCKVTDVIEGDDFPIEVWFPDGTVGRFSVFGVSAKASNPVRYLFWDEITFSTPAMPNSVKLGRKRNLLASSEPVKRRKIGAPKEAPVIKRRKING